MILQCTALMYKYNLTNHMSTKFNSFETSPVVYCAGNISYVNLISPKFQEVSLNRIFQFPTHMICSPSHIITVHAVSSFKVPNYLMLTFYWYICIIQVNPDCLSCCMQLAMLQYSFNICWLYSVKCWATLNKMWLVCGTKQQ